MFLHFLFFLANFWLAGAVTRLLSIRFANTGFGRALAFTH